MGDRFVIWINVFDEVTNVSDCPVGLYGFVNLLGVCYRLDASHLEHCGKPT